MDEYVELAQNGLEESIKYFGNKNKQERELWVIREFLSYLPLDITETDVVASNQEPNDVFYGSHGFQIKEVLSEGRKRSKEYKDSLHSIDDNTVPSDLVELCTHIHISLNETLPYVESELARHRIDKYKNNTTNINVMIYLNLTETTYTREITEYCNSEFSRWKSVSLVSNCNAIVLACNDKNNELLYPFLGELHTRN